MKKIVTAAASWESLKNLVGQDPENLIKTGLEISEKVVSKVIDTARDVEQDCRLNAEELFSFFTADVIKKDVVFYK